MPSRIPARGSRRSRPTAVEITARGTPPHSSAAETAKVTASSRSAFNGPSPTTATAATDAPTIVALREIAPAAAVARVSWTPPSSARSGMSDAFGRVARGVEQSAEEDEEEQRPEGQADGCGKNRDREHGQPAAEVGDDRGAAKAEAVDQHPAERAADDHRHRREHSGNTGGEHRAGVVQNVQRNDDRGDIALPASESPCPESRATKGKRGGVPTMAPIGAPVMAGERRGR